MGQFTQDDVRSLAEKMEQLDLTEAEASALDALIPVAPEPEVSGFVKCDVHPVRLGGVRFELQTQLLTDDGTLVLRRGTSSSS